MVPLITVVPEPANSNFIAGDTYILTGVPNTLGDGISAWGESGGGCDNGYC